MDEEKVYAMDIETDGLVQPTPTALALASNDQISVILRRNTREIESTGKASMDVGQELYEELQIRYEGCDIPEISVVVAETWDKHGTQMADQIGKAVSIISHGDVVTTYNGMAYRGGFDFPVLDLAYHRAEQDNPFRGLQHVDVYDLVDRGLVYNTTPQFPSRGGPSKSDMRGAAEMFGFEDEASGLNKAPLADLLNGELTAAQMQKWADDEGFDVPTKDDGSLEGVYAYLYSEELPDPFSDSSEAVGAWEEDNYLDLLTHNITDTVKTFRLYEYVKKSCIPARRYTPDRLG